jgi:hypothetical protein
MICARARLQRAVNLLRTMTDGQANIFHVGKLTHDILECKLNAVGSTLALTPARVKLRHAAGLSPGERENSPDNGKRLFPCL